MSFVFIPICATSDSSRMEFIMVKVLHIGEYVQGGVATYIKTLIARDREHDIDNYLFMAEEKSEHAWDFPADKIVYYSYRRSLFSLFPAIRAIQKHIRMIAPDIVFLHSSWAGMLARVPFLFGKKRPCVIYNPHGWSFLMDVSIWKKRLYAFIERILAGKTDVIINVSQYEHDFGLEFGIPKDKMRMIYNGISDDACISAENIGFPQDSINLLFVGRFDRQKGLDFLLDVWRQTSKDRIHLYVIGAPVISRGGSIYHSDEGVSFLGWKKNDKIRAYYRSADAVIMPSRWEAFGLTAIEGFRDGCPVIASDRGALPELIQDGVTGYLFSLDDAHQLIDILQNLSSAKLADMGRRARELYCEKFTAERMLDEVAVVYRSLI